MAFALWSDLCAIEKTCVVREAFLQAVVQNTKHITKNICNSSYDSGVCKCLNCELSIAILTPADLCMSCASLCNL